MKRNRFTDGMGLRLSRVLRERGIFAPSLTRASIWGLPRRSRSTT